MTALQAIKEFRWKGLFVDWAWRLRCGEMLPTGYRVAWEDFCQCKYVLMPIGLHWIGMFCWWVYWLTYRFPRDRIGERCQEAYERGVRDAENCMRLETFSDS